MEEKNPSQLELFSQVNKPNQAGERKASFIYYMRGYEKVIIFIIFFIVTAIVSFSLGVENSKAVALRKTEMPIELAHPAAANMPVATTKPAVKIKPAAAISVIPAKTQNPVQNFIQSYTIQVATFQTKSGAEKEAALLKRKGMITSIITRGKYSILCVGNFPDKDAAKQTLSELKKQYGDCMLRRI